MSTKGSHMFSLKEAAIAYATAAERILGDDAEFLKSNPAVVPIFVSMLFQSLEISIKHAGIESELFTMQEARNRQNRSGHGIKELAILAIEKLGGDLDSLGPGAAFDPIVSAMTFFNSRDGSSQYIHEMICGDALEKSREVYASRRLGYGQICEGDFVTMGPIVEWVFAVKETAMNLPKTIDILSQWRKSPSGSKHFAIRYRGI